jgi:hypothetical protein
MSELEAQGKTITAQTIVGAVCDQMAVYSVPITSRARAILGKQAKELLADGFAPDVILASCVIALRRSEAHVAHHIAQDIVLMQAGRKLSRADYNAEMAQAQARLDPAKAAQRARLEKALED